MVKYYSALRMVITIILTFCSQQIIFAQNITHVSSKYSPSLGGDDLGRFPGNLVHYLEDQITVNDSQVSFFDFNNMKVDWRPYLGPVINQGKCSNCWSESLIQVFDGALNKHMNSEGKRFYGDSTGLIRTSSDQLTKCTSQQFIKTLSQDKQTTYTKDNGNDAYQLYGCSGGTWDGARFILIGTIKSPLSEGLSTIGNYDQQTASWNPDQEIICQSGSFKINKGFQYTSFYRTETLNVGPVATAMVIPGCNEGVFSRGGNSGVTQCKSEDPNDCQNNKFRGCVEHSDLIRKYQNSDIIMANDETQCKYLYTGSIGDAYTHDSVIIGRGSSGVISYLVIKQSWGTSFGHQGYMNIQYTGVKETSVFCSEHWTVPAPALEYRDPQTREWKQLQNPFCGYSKSTHKVICDCRLTENGKTDNCW